MHRCSSCARRRRSASVQASGATARKSRPIPRAASSTPRTGCGRRARHLRPALRRPAGGKALDRALRRSGRVGRRQRLDRRRGGRRPRLRRLDLRLLLQAPRAPRHRRPRPRDPQRDPLRAAAPSRFANAFWDAFSNAMFYGDGDREFARLLGRARRGGPRADPRSHAVHVGRGLRGRVRRAQRGVLGHHGDGAPSSSSRPPATGGSRPTTSWART